MIRRLLRALRPLHSRHRVEREIDDELRFHVEMETEKLVRKGMPPGEARREALRRFGGVERFKEEVRDVDGVSLVEGTWNDLRFGLRVLRKNPVFSAVAVVTLALGIGAGTAIFSVVKGILLEPLPYPEPGELVTVWSDYTGRDGPEREWLAFPDFHDVRTQVASIEEAGVYGGWRPTLTGTGEPERLEGGQVTRGMLTRVLGVEPLLGRGFLEEEDRPDGPRAVLLGHGLWTRRFGRDPEVVGQTVTLSEQPYTVVGVLPADFRPPFLTDAEIWTTLQQDMANNCGRGCVTLRGLARLGPGIPVERAEEEVRALGRRLAAEYPDSNTGVGLTVIPLQDDLVGELETPLWLLLGAAGFLLLIACVNVANLLLGRLAAREGELAIRSTLGAGRGRITRQLVVETALLFFLGGGLGVLLAYGGVELLVRLAPPETPRLENVGVDGTVLGFALAATLATASIFGLLPALRAGRSDLQGALRSEGRGSAGGGGARLRSGLVVAQTALALVLLVGAGLMIRTFQGLREVDPGFEPEGVLALRLSLPTNRYPDGPERIQFYEGLLERLRALPGVTAVGSVNSLPMEGRNSDVSYSVEGRPPPEPGREPGTWIRVVSPGYLEAIGTPIVRGRGLTESDTEETPLVIVINETLAEEVFPGEDPIGKRISFGDPWREIVGVAADIRNFGVRRSSEPATYIPYAQVPFTEMALVLRTEAADPATLTPAVRRAVAELDPRLAASGIRPLVEIVRGTQTVERFSLGLLGLFAAVAVLLASVGLYGVVSYTVTRRLREMGVRITLGADAGAIRTLVVGRSLALAGVGVVLGLGAALALTGYMESLLYQVSPTDPVTFAGTALLLLAVAAAASAVPAWRAGRVDPMEVLRSE